MSVNKIIKENLKQGELKNGLKYILNNDNSYKSTSIFMFVRVGSKHEKEKEFGMAHFLEHLLFKGTKKFKSNIDLNKEIDNLTGTTNASTGKNFTNYYIKLPTENLLKGLVVLKEMVFESIIETKEFIKEKDVVIEEMNKTFEDSESFIEDVLPYYLFKNHNLEHYIIGSKKSIKEMKRNEIMKFYKKYYIPSNCLLIISGNFEKDIENHIPKIFNIKNNDVINHNYKPYNFKHQMKIISNYREHFQITIGIAFPLFNCYDNRKYCLDILMSYLDGNMTSQLWINLREKNPLVYDSDAEYELFEEGGIFYIKYSLEKKNVFKSIEEVYKIIEKLKKEKIPVKEFKRFQKNTILNLNIDREDNTEVCNFYGENYIFGNKLITYQDVINEYNNCTNESLYDLANYIFDYNKCIVVQLGDIDKKDFKKKVEKIIKIN